MSVVRLTGEHRPLFYSFMISNSSNGIMSHHRRGALIALDAEMAHLFLDDMLTLAVIQNGVIKQLALVYADGSNNLVLRYFYGSYSPETPALLDAIRKYAVIMYPSITQYSFVIKAEEHDMFMGAWNKTVLSTQATGMVWNNCVAHKRPADYWLRDTVLGCGVPMCDLRIMTVSVNYSTEESFI